MSDEAKQTMDNVMDRRKIVKVKEFKKSGSQWVDANPTYAPGNNWNDSDFEAWQRNNKNIKVISTSVIRKVIASAPPPPPPPTPATYTEEIMYVSYEMTEEIV